MGVLHPNILVPRLEASPRTRAEPESENGV